MGRRHRRRDDYTKPDFGSVEIDLDDPTNSSLVGCWLMNEGAGIRFTNLVSGGGDAIVSGVIQSQSSGWTSDRFLFDQTDDFADCGNPPQFIVLKEPFAVEAWIRFTSASTFMAIAGNGILNGGVTGHGLYTNLTKISYQVRNAGGAASIVDSPLAYNDGNLHCAFGWRANGVTSLAVDGQVVATDSTAVTLSTDPTTWKIGSGSNTSSNALRLTFGGSMYAVRYWNGRAPSADEAKQAYNAGPYRGLIDLRRRSSASASVLAAITASLNVTLGQVLAASVAAAAIVGSASNGLANESVSSSGQAAGAASTSGTVSESLAASSAVQAAANASGTVPETMTGSGAAGIAANASGATVESETGTATTAVSGNLNQSTKVSESGSATVAIVSAVNQTLAACSVSSVVAVALKSTLTQVLENVRQSAQITVGNSANLSAILQNIGLSAAGNVSGSGRIAILVETLQDVHLIAVFGHAVRGPFRVVGCHVSIPGAVQISYTVPGSIETEISSPGAEKTAVIAENLT